MYIPIHELYELKYEYIYINKFSFTCIDHLLTSRKLI